MRHFVLIPGRGVWHLGSSPSTIFFKILSGVQTMSLTASSYEYFLRFELEFIHNSINKALADGRMTQDDVDLVTAFISERKITQVISSQRSLN